MEANIVLGPRSMIVGDDSENQVGSTWFRIQQSLRSKDSTNHLESQKMIRIQKAAASRPLRATDRAIGMAGAFWSDINDAEFHKGSASPCKGPPRPKYKFYPAASPGSRSLGFARSGPAVLDAHSPLPSRDYEIKPGISTSNEDEPPSASPARSTHEASGIREGNTPRDSQT